MTYIIEVQHSSDHNLDGKWHELDRTEDQKHADFLIKYFGDPNMGLRDPVTNRKKITGSYAGRPLRIREERE